MIAVGDEITRDRDGARFRLVGVSEGQWVAAPLEGFGSPVRLSARELAGFVGASNPRTDPDPYATETQGWNVLSEAAEANRLREAPQALSPEEFFNETAAADKQEKASGGRSERREGISAAKAQALGHRKD